VISGLSWVLASAIFSITFESSVIAMNARITAGDATPTEWFATN
jgi:hypothetical protein